MGSILCALLPAPSSTADRLQRLADAVVPARFVVSEYAVVLMKTYLLGLAARLQTADLLASVSHTAEERAQSRGPQ